MSERDIVERLRNKQGVNWDDCLEAANAIVQLRAELERLRGDLEDANASVKAAYHQGAVKAADEIERLHKRAFSAEAAFRALQDANEEEDHAIREVSR